MAETQQPNHPWQPFATAPKDATDILTWDHVFGFGIAVGDDNGWTIYHIEDEELVTDVQDTFPDFWRPMPPGPGEEPENAILVRTCRAVIQHLTGDYGEGGSIMTRETVLDMLQAAIDDAEEPNA